MAKIARANVSTRTIRVSRTVKVANSAIGANVDTSRFRYHKIPTPATDGATTVFTLPDSEQYVGGSLRIYRDQLYMYKTTDFAETTSTTFTMVSAPDADEELSCSYTRLGA